MKSNDEDWIDKSFPILPIIVIIMCIVFMIWFGLFTFDKIYIYLQNF